jgi:hypothetical protein
MERDDADPNLVANVAEAVIILAAKAGLGVVGTMKITLDFDASGDVTITIPDAAPVVVKAADIAAAADTDEDREHMETA